jgi:hypothetical protein
MSVIKAATAWPTNADMIADVASLGYIKADDVVLDPTYGRGLWWTKFTPANLTKHDIAIDRVDFRSLPHEANKFDVVAYDPPYVCVGGRATTTMPDLHDRYGLTDAPRTPSALQCMINEGLSEAARVVKPRGHIIVKCQDYVSSGKLWIGTHHTLQHGVAIGLTCVDKLEHLAGIRPQPPNRRQVHARRNLSTLFVFQKMKQ